MIIETSKLDTTQQDGNVIVITMQITLEEDDVMTYMQLDELLREHSGNTDVLDAVSDYGFSYSNDVLSTIYWDRLNDLLSVIHRIVKDGDSR
jgi:hypothetical protein